MEVPQDFSRKIVVVLCEDLKSWELTNTVGHIAAYLGNKMEHNFDTGKHFQSKDGHLYPRNSQYAIVALKASKSDLKVLVAKLQTEKFLWIAYVQDMIDLMDDVELAHAMEQKISDEMDVLGVGIFATKDELKLLTGKLQLWK